MSDWQVVVGDMRDVLRGLEPDTVDAVVCDPPYGLSFMGKEWDHGVPGVEFWTEARRVMKPGAHLVAFGGTRTFHRLGAAVEDAGLEMRDCLCYLYGSGFPKSLDVSKAIDNALGAERSKVRVDGASVRNPKSIGSGHGVDGGDRPWMQEARARGFHELDGPDPVTAAAAALQGWGTALKPAWEGIILARKRLVGTVAANVMEHGTGALNIDGCRIEAGGDSETRGRWPANVVLDEDAAAQLDEAVPEAGGGIVTPYVRVADNYFSGGWPRHAHGGGHDLGGGASRFFYTSKASPGERHYAGRNDHPTVKPVSLMRWLVRLVTPPRGLVLDPFCGSGTTGIAALAEGFQFIGVDIDERNCELARRRIAGPLFADTTEGARE